MIRTKARLRATRRSFNRRSKNFQGSLMMVAACFCIAVMVSVVRHLSQDFHVFFLVMMRSLFGLVFLIPYVIKNTRTVFKTSKFKLHAMRGVNGFMSLVVWFYVLTKLPLSEAVSISFTVPIVTIALASIFLKEKVKSHVWFGTIVGIVGILVILRPGFREVSINHLYAFGSVVLWSISNLLIKTMTKTEKPQAIVFYLAVITFVISVPFSIPYFKGFGIESLFWFLLLGLSSNLIQYFISTSYSKTDLSVVQPLDFTRLIFISIIAYFAFGEVVDLWVIFGSVVIFCGVLVALPRKRREAKNDLELIL